MFALSAIASLGTMIVVFFLFSTIADAQTKSNDPFALTLIQSARSITTAPYQDTVFGIGFKNTSGIAWKKTDAEMLTLRSSAKKESYFHDATWKSRNVVMDLPRDARAGELVYFWFTLEAPKEEGSYIEELSLYRGNQKISETVTRIPITVKKQDIEQAEQSVAPSSMGAAAVAGSSDSSRAIAAPALSPAQPFVPPPTPSSMSGTYAALKLIVSAPSITVKQAERITFGIGFKNTGTAAWKRSDILPITLRSSAKKESYFYDSSWKAQNIVMDAPSDAQAGELVYFWFTLFAPVYPGAYEENLFLTRNGEKIAGSDVRIPITVMPRSSTVLTGLSGQSGQDAGAAIIETDSPVSSSSAPDTSLNSFSPTPTLSQDPRPGILDERTEQEPLIRVGLYSTKDPVRITANKDYEVRDSDGALLTVERAGIVSTIIFDWILKAYTLTTPTVSLGTIKYLRFGPVQSDTAALAQTSDSPGRDIIFEIPSYTNHPSWSSALNDNTFRSLLEVRYAPQTNRLWVVNELKLENYLKGIGETSNSSPYEYQKALLTAARTYAKYHIDRSTKHAADGFTVSPTEADQVYRGYGVEKRLPNVARAVDETRGVIVTYGGQLAITPYFSQSDGRTRSWEDVWGGSPKPWLVGKDDPLGQADCSTVEKKRLCGHYVGMSARGAIGMALDNKSFEEILKYYYTGIELKRIY